MLNHLFQLSGLLLLLNLLVIPFKLFGQSQYANINLDDFEMGTDSYVEYGAELNYQKLLLFDTIAFGGVYSLELKSSIDTSLHLAVSLTLDNTTYSMEIDGLQIFDENGLQISTNAVADTDEVYFVLINNYLQYKQNDIVLKDTLVTPASVPEFLTENFTSIDTDIYVSIYDSLFNSSTTGDLLGMTQRTTSPYCVIPLALIPLEAKYLCGPFEPPMDFEVELFYTPPPTFDTTSSIFEINLGFPDVLVNIKNLDDQTSIVALSNDDGYFRADIEEGMLQLIPFTDQQTLPYDNSGDTTAFGYDCYLNPPISVQDEQEIRDHIDDTDIIDCALKRIAADINHNGQIDTLDANLIRNFVLGNIDSLADRRWRYVPKAYVIPSSVHPDPGFIANFWNATKADSRDQEYPFNASFSFNGTTYRYLGENSWMERLHEWPYSLNEACEDTNWGFYLIEIGDVVQTRTGGGGFFLGNNLVSSNESNTLPSRSFKPVSRLPRKENKKTTGNEKNNQKLSLQVKATSSIPIYCYQIGLVLNEVFSEVDKIKPKTGKIKQTLKDNFGQRKKNLDAGVIRTAWIRDVKTEPNGVLLNEDVLFEIDLKAKKTEDLSSEEMLQLIRLDELVLPSIFYGDEVIDNQVKITIEVLDKGEVIQSFSVRN